METMEKQKLFGNLDMFENSLTITCGDGSIDVKGREIRIRKSVENKGFPGVGTVWMTVSIPGFFAFGKFVGTGLL